MSKTEKSTRTPSKKLWIIFGFVFAIFALAVFAYFRDDELEDFSDLAYTPVLTPDADQVFVEWVRVFALADEAAWMAELDADRQLMMRFSGRIPWKQEPVTKIISANQRMIDAAIAADALGAFRLPQQRGINDSAPYLSQLQFTSKLLKLHAIDRHRAGDAEAATETMLVGLRFSDRALAGSATLIDLLVAITGGAINNSAIDQLVSGGIGSEQLAALDAALAGEPSYSSDLQRVLRHEFNTYIEGLDTMDDVADYFGDAAIIPSMQYRPNRTTNALAEFFRGYIPAVGQEPGKRRFPTVPPPPDGLRRFSSNALGQALVAGGTPVFGSIVEKCDLQLAYRRALRLKIALARYQLEHGSLPADLSALVPTCLDALPLDPYDRKPLRFDSSRGAVWSIGKNLTDDGGGTDASIDFMTKKEPDPTLWLAPREVGPEPPEGDSRSSRRSRSRRSKSP